jgi:hypothetical protein
MIKGLPDTPVADERGYYSATVGHGWSGTVVPIKEGYKFRPHATEYPPVTKDRPNQNYVAEPITYTISGGTGLSGVLMRGLTGPPVTDERGNYTATVMYGWSGTVSPKKAGFRFDPAERQYAKVIHNQTNQNYSPRRAGPASILGRSGSRKVLVIPAIEIIAEELAATMEDMHVMSHILDERFKERRQIKGLFTDFGDFFGRDNRATEATYLQGYGVLFLMEVNFAFSPPPKSQEQEAEKTAEHVDSTWQRARQQIFSPKDLNIAGESDSLNKEYDSQMVEELKRELITTLRHAANIRNMRPSEWVILTVIGGRRELSQFFSSRPPMMGAISRPKSSTYGRTSSGGMSGYAAGGYGAMGGGMYGGMAGGMGGFGGGMGGYGGGMGGYGGGMGGMTGFGEMGVSSATVLTIRVKKAQVDAFAKGELDFDEFRRHVQIFTY